MTSNSWRFCAAPMMDWSDRHCRYFWRLLSQHTRLYTEMITTGALLHGDRARLLRYHPAEQPLALQLGGSDPADLALCARIAEDAGFSEVNLNCGCPSDRVQNGKIGACLMAEPDLVATCVAAMNTAVTIPVTVKHRIGIDDQDSCTHLDRFVSTLANAGCKVFIVHARKAWLQGLSPKQNREVPPLDYQRVSALKQSHPELTIVINGGINSVSQSEQLLTEVDGVMLGRELYHNPYLLAGVDQRLFGDTRTPLCRDEVLERFAEYCANEIVAGNRLQRMSRHVLGLYLNQPGGRKFRRYLSEHATQPGATHRCLLDAREAMQLARPGAADPAPAAGTHNMVSRL